MRIARYVTSDLSLCNDRPLCDLWRIQNFIPMGVESYLVLWVFTDECCHPNRFRVELMPIESFEIGRLDFPNRDTLKSTHCFLPHDPSSATRHTRRSDCKPRRHAGFAAAIG